MSLGIKKQEASSVSKDDFIFYLIVGFAILGISLAVINPMGMPIIYAEEQERIITQGKNYDETILKMDNDKHIITKKLTFVSERISPDGKSWHDYLFSNRDGTMRFESSKTSFEFHDDTGDFKIWSGGMIGNRSPDIPSFATTLKTAVNGTDKWEVYPAVGNSYSYEETSDGMKITFNQKHEDAVLKTIFDAEYHEGLKWTYEISNISRENAKFGITTTCNDCGELFIDGKGYLNGQWSKKDLLNDDGTYKQLQIKGFAFDPQDYEHDYLWAFKNINGNIIFDFTYSRGTLEIGDTLRIDPTFSYVTSTDEISAHAAGVSGVACGSPNAIYDNEIQAETFARASSSATHFSCHRGSFTWDTSSIPDTATIDDVDIRYDITTASNARNCSIYQISTDPTTLTVNNAFNGGSTADATTLWNDIGDGNVYISNDSACTSVGNDKLLDLGNDANTDLQNLLASDWFAIGVKTHDETRDSSHHTQNYDNVELEVVYTDTLPPDAITDLVSTRIDSSSVDLQWSQPNLNGGILENYLINFTTPHGIPQTFLANSTDTTYDVTGLTSNTQYSFRVSGLSEFGYGTGGNILDITTSEFDPPGTPILGASALSDTSIRFTSAPGGIGDNSTAWFGVRCDLNDSGSWANEVLNSTIPADRIWEKNGLTFGDAFVCQWRDGSAAGWSSWSNNATDTLQLQVLQSERTTSSDPLKNFENFVESVGGFYFGLGLFPMVTMILGFMAGKKTVRIFTLITLFMMGILHASGYFVYPDWYWALALLLGLGLVMGRQRAD